MARLTRQGRRTSALEAPAQQQDQLAQLVAQAAPVDVRQPGPEGADAPPATDALVDAALDIVVSTATDAVLSGATDIVVADATDSVVAQATDAVIDNVLDTVLDAAMQAVAAATTDVVAEALAAAQDAAVDVVPDPLAGSPSPDVALDRVVAPDRVGGAGSAGAGRLTARTSPARLAARQGGTRAAKAARDSAARHARAQGHAAAERSRQSAHRASKAAQAGRRHAANAAQARRKQAARAVRQQGAHARVAARSSANQLLWAAVDSPVLQTLSRRARQATQYKKAQARRARIRRLSLAAVLAAATGTAIGVYLNRLPAPGTAPASPAETPNAVVAEVPGSRPGLLIPATDPAAGAGTTPTGGDTFPDPAAAEGQQP